MSLTLDGKGLLSCQTQGRLPQPLSGEQCGDRVLPGREAALSREALWGVGEAQHLGKVCF